MIGEMFQGQLVSTSHVHVNEDVFMKFSIKHICTLPSQSFLRSLELELGNDTIQSNFKEPVLWKSLVFDTSDWEYNHFKILFDVVEFEASLVAIKVKQVVKPGEVFFEYVLEFLKDVEKENDSTFIKSYFKVKDMNEEMKMVPIDFDIEMTLIRDRANKVDMSDEIESDREELA